KMLITSIKEKYPSHSFIGEEAGGVLLDIQIIPLQRDDE
uniref:Myo-inositol 1-phosphatase (Fragments) n=1 Tax=Bos taurus TaxID=9913 RepID=Q7M2R9_BOVIN